MRTHPSAPPDGAPPCCRRSGRRRAREDMRSRCHRPCPSNSPPEWSRALRDRKLLTVRSTSTREIYTAGVAQEGQGLHRAGIFHRRDHIVACRRNSASTRSPTRPCACRARMCCWRWRRLCATKGGLSALGKPAKRARAVRIAGVSGSTTSFVSRRPSPQELDSACTVSLRDRCARAARTAAGGAAAHTPWPSPTEYHARPLRTPGRHRSRGPPTRLTQGNVRRIAAADARHDPVGFGEVKARIEAQGHYGRRGLCGTDARHHAENAVVVEPHMTVSGRTASRGPDARAPPRADIRQVYRPYLRRARTWLPPRPSPESARSGRGQPCRR